LGKVKVPEIIELPPFKGELGTSIQFEIPVDGRNRQLEQAKTKVKERYVSSTKLKERENLHKTFRTIS